MKEILLVLWFARGFFKATPDPIEPHGCDPELPRKDTLEAKRTLWRCIMTELELIQLWNKLRNQVIFSQLAPTFLLIVTIALINDGLADSALEVRLATMGILLASGIFGYLAQYSTATEARAVLAEIRALKTKTKLSTQLVKFANWLDVIRYVTPAIFVGIYVFLGIALLF